jgi:hypothetical protein
MIRNTVLSLVFLIALLGSCKKDTHTPAPTPTPVPDTIKPLSYYPVFPGSWWRYLQNDTGIVLSKVSLTYLSNSYKISTGPGPMQSPICMVPYLDGQPIYRYQTPTFIPPPFGGYYQLWPFLSETVGVTFEAYWTDPRTNGSSEQITVISKTLVGSDSILTLQGRIYNSPYSSHKLFFRYQKGVGLINSCEIDTLTNDTITSRRLLTYYIGH